MARRMIDPQVIIKSQIVDDKESVDLNEILEKYGTTFYSNKTITLQFYNKLASDEPNNFIYDDSESLGVVAFNGSITVTKDVNSNIFIQGRLLDSSDYLSPLTHLKISSGSYENGIILSSNFEFDVHVIKV